MARPTLPRAPSAAGRTRGRALAAADGLTGALRPLLLVLRGLCVLATAGRRSWARIPKERRGPALALLAAGALAIGLAPYGPLLALLGLVGAAVWAGRGAPGSRVPHARAAERLRTLYEALVPHFGAVDDPQPLYAYAGTWERAFEEYEFTADGRPSRLVLRYPAYFAAGDAAARWRVERLLAAKSGPGREYRFDWDEEAGRLTFRALPALPTNRRVQRFVTAPGETVLGFTDPEAVQRTLPVVDLAGRAEDAPPVLWRTGARSTEPHLLALGQPGSGTTTLLRSLLLQALPHADVLVVDAAGSGGYGVLHGRPGVLAVESELAGAVAAVEWAAHETERRLRRAHQARRLGEPLPDDVRRPLWVVVDRPAALSPLAVDDGRRDPQALLRVPLRHGRPANITVVVADQLDDLAALSPYVLTGTRARVLLGPATHEQAHRALGAAPPTSAMRELPPGRGFARLGHGPVYRLQVPAAPDPCDDATSEADRAAVLALLPGQGVAVEAAGPAAPGHPAAPTGRSGAGGTPGVGEASAGAPWRAAAP